MQSSGLTPLRNTCFGYIFVKSFRCKRVFGSFREWLLVQCPGAHKTEPLLFHWEAELENSLESRTRTNHLFTFDLFCIQVKLELLSSPPDGIFLLPEMLLSSLPVVPQLPWSLMWLVAALGEADDKGRILGEGGRWLHVKQGWHLSQLLGQGGQMK